MKIRSLIPAVILICLSIASSAEAGDLIRYIAKLKNKIPRSYIAPTDTQTALFREAVFHILRAEFAGATSAADAIGYKVGAFTHTNGSTYYILESTGPKFRQWGTFVFKVGSDKKNYIIEAPHPIEEKNTSIIGIKAFIDSEATAFLLSGSRKSACDVTLDQNTFFHAAHEVISSSYSNIVSLQIHGFNRKDYPNVVLTSGTPVAISAMDDLVEQLMLEDFVVGIYNGTLYSDYGATQNEQAKYTNSIGGSFIGLYLNQAVHNSKKKGDLIVDVIEGTLTETTTPETPT